MVKLLLSITSSLWIMISIGYANVTFISYLISKFKKKDIEENEETLNQQSFPLTLEQYICKNCNKKFYINEADKTEQRLMCTFCNSDTENIRTFQSTINSIVTK